MLEMIFGMRGIDRGPRKCTDFHDVQPWDEDKTKFDSRLVLAAETYKPFRPFKVLPLKGDQRYKSANLQLGKAYRNDSPNGNFRYTEWILEAGEWIDVVQGNRSGKVCFTGDIAVPRVCQLAYGGQKFEMSPWMSYTPMEILTQRGGVRRAKGHVVIGGLGLGWVLRKVLDRKQVTQVTLVEQSQELLDWMPLPEDDRLTVVCGDANEVIPNMEADVALIDIWPSYGGNYFKKCPKIGHVWVWGSQFAGGSGYW